MRLRRIVFIALAAVTIITMWVIPCTAQEYAGWVLDAQALKGIKHVLVAPGYGNASNNAAQVAVKRIQGHKLERVKATLWTEDVVDLSPFDACLFIDAFNMSRSEESGTLYTLRTEKKWSWTNNKFITEEVYEPGTVSVDVQASWITLHLLRIDASNPSPARRLGPIIYTSSYGESGFSFDVPSTNPSAQTLAILERLKVYQASVGSVITDLIDALVNDMKIIDPQTWTKRAEDQPQPPESRPIATVNGEPITWQEFISRMKDTGSEGYNVLDQTIDTNGQDILDQMISESLIRQAAKKAGIKVSSYEIDAELSMIQNQLGTSYGEVLAQYGMTENALRTNIEMNFLAVKYSTKDLVITDEDLRRYFEENKDLYTRPEIVRVSHILVDTEEEAKQIAQQLKDGADFATLATEKSTDTMSAANGGDLDWFSRGQMVEPFEKVAFSMRPGQISEPVKTDYGYHIIKMTDRKPAYEAVFDEVRYDVERDFRTSKASSFAELAASLRAEGEITITCKTSMH